ncbi:MAG: formate dehydrogenase accessory sulfurtransferase FdhD [Bacillota bacterium]|nr:formate dehydrogenase accessory sulfurtransferase FdhD [Bacillota bacterium]
MESVNRRTVREINQGEIREKEDSLLVELPLTLEVNGEEFVTMLCTPTNLDDLVLGFLFSEGLADGADDLAELEIDEQEGRVRVTTRRRHELAAKLYGKRTLTTGCGRGTIFYHVTDALKTHRVESDLRLSAGTILAALKGWGEKAELFAKTGCPHSAALLTAEGGILCLAEDAGRHNAVDKVIGRSLREGWSRRDKCLATTGRISSEILIKVAKADIPVVVSRSAATDLAVALAQELGITAAGFARGRRLNVYTHPERILP